MPYLVDSGIINDHLAAVPAAQMLLAHLAASGICIRVITYMEAYQGVLHSSLPTRASRQFDALLQTLPVLPFSLSVAKRCARLREDLRGADRRVHGRALDLMVAAIALEYHLTLVTRNEEDYRDILGLGLTQSLRQAGSFSLNSKSRLRLDASSGWCISIWRRWGSGSPRSIL